MKYKENFEIMGRDHKNKVMKANEHWEKLREKSQANIQSEKGILNRCTAEKVYRNRTFIFCTLKKLVYSLKPPSYYFGGFTIIYLEEKHFVSTHFPLLRFQYDVSLQQQSPWISYFYILHNKGASRNELVQ